VAHRKGNARVKTVKAKRAKPARVYPAESDPRQENGFGIVVGLQPKYMVSAIVGALAVEFGPWVRGADGRWQRDRRKR